MARSILHKNYSLEESVAINASTLANWYRTVIEYSSLSDFTYHYSTLPFHYFEWFEESPVATEEYVKMLWNLCGT